MKSKLGVKAVTKKLSSLKFNPEEPIFKAVLESSNADFCILRAREELSLSGLEPDTTQENAHIVRAIQLLVAGLLLREQE